MSASLEHDVEFLREQITTLRNQIRHNHQLLDVLATPPWRRIWFTLCGWHPWKVGRWYGSKDSNEEYPED